MTQPERLPQQSSSSERNAYVRRNLLAAGVFTAGLLGAVFALGFFFEETLEQWTYSVYDALGLLGLAALIFSADSITTPIPPDAVLLVVAHTPLATHWFWVVPGLGLVSAGAGLFGWLLGKTLGEHRLLAPTIARFRSQHGGRVQRYGPLTVVLGALTPLPFSLTCWSAGAVGMPLRTFAPLSLLRLPRCLAYYGLMVFAVSLIR